MGVIFLHVVRSLRFGVSSSCSDVGWLVSVIVMSKYLMFIYISPAAFNSFGGGVLAIRMPRLGVDMVVSNLQLPGWINPCTIHFLCRRMLVHPPQYGHPLRSEVVWW
jgi:hypothetical protein